MAKGASHVGVVVKHKVTPKRRALVLQKKTSKNMRGPSPRTILAHTPAVPFLNKYLRVLGSKANLAPHPVSPRIQLDFKAHSCGSSTLKGGRGTWSSQWCSCQRKPRKENWYKLIQCSYSCFSLPALRYHTDFPY